MAGRSPLVASAGQEAELRALSRSDVRGETDRARAILLTLRGWTSLDITEALGVTPGVVRHWQRCGTGGGGSLAAAWTCCAPRWRLARPRPRASGPWKRKCLAAPTRRGPDQLDAAAAGGRSPAATARSSCWCWTTAPSTLAKLAGRRWPSGPGSRWNGYPGMPGTERHRAHLARPQAASPGPPHVRGRRRPHGHDPCRGQATQQRTHDSPPVLQPRKCCSASSKRVIASRLAKQSIVTAGARGAGTDCFAALAMTAAPGTWRPMP